MHFGIPNKTRPGLWISATESLRAWKWRRASLEVYGMNINGNNLAGAYC